MSHRWSSGRHAVVLVVAAMAVATLAPAELAAANTPAPILRVAHYAFETAAHHRPPRIVDALDLMNAMSVIEGGQQIGLAINLGTVPQWPNIADFIDAVTFQNYCVQFSTVLDQAPRAVSCPRHLIAVWTLGTDATSIAQRAIAAAASRGRAVSGDDVRRADTTLTLSPVPRFAAGAGGVVRFVSPKDASHGVAYRTSVCVRFPRTAYGTPQLVLCPRGLAA